MGILPRDDNHLSAHEVDGLVSSSQNETRRSNFKSSPEISKKAKDVCIKRRTQWRTLCGLMVAICLFLYFTGESVSVGGVKAVTMNFLDGFTNSDKAMTDDEIKIEDYNDDDDVKELDQEGVGGDGEVEEDDDDDDDDDDLVEEEPKKEEDDEVEEDEVEEDDDDDDGEDLVENVEPEENEAGNETNDDDDDDEADSAEEVEDEANANEDVSEEKEAETSNNTDEAKEESAGEDDDTILNDIEYYQHEVLSDEEQKTKEEEMVDKWGHWHFWDGAAESRPTEDYLGKYPNNDCPFDGFPETAWQADAVYVNHIIDSALELVDRAKEAFYTEYGYGPRDDITSDQLMTRMKMFRLSVIPDLNADTAADKIKLGLERGGWTTGDSFKGMSRRMLHAMMTNDDFTVVLAGDSGAAGHGNHFLQSYMAQFDYIMRPIFERMNVNLVTRNLANGDIGTLSNALGSGSIYGDNIDMIIWDSDITNVRDSEATADLFFRQALLAGKRPPILMGPHSVMNILKELNESFGAEIVVLGTGMGSLPQTESEEQVKELAQAVRYLNCTDEFKDECLKHKYNARCWVERDDVQPPTPQRRTPNQFQSSTNPGFKEHHLKGRLLSFLMLELIADALSNWGDVTIVAGHPLDGDYWHLTDYYNDIKTKLQEVEDGEYGLCSSMKDYIPERVCTIPLQARTEFTPRFDPANTSILNILNPASDGFVPSSSVEMVYETVDVPNPSLLLPKEVIDVHAIVSNRRLLEEKNDKNLESGTVGQNKSYIRRRMSIETSKAWELDTLPGTCDGTPTAICGRVPTSDCLLYGHMDHKGGLVGDNSSGWLSMKLPSVSHGIIMLNFAIESLEDGFNFEFAIDGDITTLSKDEFFSKKKSPEPNVDIVTLMDDPSFASDDGKTIDFAFQFKDCNTCKFKLTHVYWA